MMKTASKGAPRGRPIQAKRLSLFATPLAVCVLPDSEALKAPLSALLDVQYRGALEASDAKDRPVARPWQGDFAEAGTAEAELATVIEAAVALTQAMTPGSEGSWDVAWRGEALQPGEGFEVQALPGALWCAHYLIDAGGGNGGALDLQDPRGAAPVMYAPGLTFAAEGAETLGVSQSIGLKEGALAVFPAWMLQSTALHAGDRPRLSLTLRLRPRSEET